MSGSIQTWTIDAAGNFDDIGFGGPSQDRDHNLQNEITELDGEEIHYDGNGNLFQDEAMALTYVYDGWNRLTAIITLVGMEWEGPEYHYDALGRRIKEERWEPAQVGEERHLYYNDAWQVIHDQQPFGVIDPEGEPIPVYNSYNSYYWSVAGGDMMNWPNNNPRSPYVFPIFVEFSSSCKH